MPAVTVVRSRSSVIGSKRMVAATVTVANSGDTWAVPGIKTIDAVVASPATAIAATRPASSHRAYFITCLLLFSGYGQSWKYWCTSFRMSSMRCCPFGGPRFHKFGPRYERSVFML